MTDYSVIRFKDESLGRVTPTAGIKWLNQKKFTPVTCKDLPDEDMLVKWQKSAVDGSFSSDGYFRAEVLAIAGSVRTALAKAKEMNVRMHSSPVLTHLPEAPGNNSPIKTGKRVRTSKADSSKQGSTSKPQQHDLKAIVKQHESKKISKKQIKADSRKRRSSSVDKVSQKRKKTIKLNDVALERCSTEAAKAIQSNPLVKDSVIANDGPIAEEINASLEPALEESNSSKPSVGDESLILPEEDDEDLTATDVAEGSEEEEAETGQAELKLPNKVEEMDSASSSSASSESSQSNSGSDDEVAALSESNKTLQNQLNSLKKQLSECKRDLTLANNLRVAHRDQCSKLKADLQFKETQINALQKRNNTLQDLLCQKSSDPMDSKVPGKSFESHDDFDEHSPSKDRNNAEVGNKSLTPKSEKMFQPSTPSKRSDSKSPSLVSSSEKKRIKKKGEFLDSKVVQEVCEKVLSHLKGENSLEEDKRGFVDLGPVQLDKQALEKNLVDYKDDISKMAKGIATLTWTPQERAQRSLEGGKNNRYPNAPSKKAATPLKVDACLGIVKAHLLHEGEKEGSGLRQNLKLCRRAIGARFSQDYAQAKK